MKRLFFSAQLPVISTIHGYGNQQYHPRTHRKFIDLSNNKVTPFTLKENDQYYQPQYKVSICIDHFLTHQSVGMIPHCVDAWRIS